MKKLALTLAASMLALSAPSAVAGGGSGSFDRYRFTNDQGTRTYKVFVPPAWHGQSLPLVVELHGCYSNADLEARASRLNEMAAKRRVLVAYPEETGEGCWSWFDPNHQTRDRGEPAIIAGITREVQRRWRADPSRTYLAGFSAGAGMAVNVLTSYPDLYAAALIHAGCEYKGSTCTGNVAVVPPSVSGDWAYAQMGARARVVPLLVSNGEQDVTVPAVNGDLITRAALRIADRVEQAAGRPTPMSRQPAATRTLTTKSGRSTDVRVYADLRGCPLVEQWLIKEMGHQWPQDPNNATGLAYLKGPFGGPDLAGAAMNWFLQHPMPRSTRGCSTNEGT